MNSEDTPIRVKVNENIYAYIYLKKEGHRKGDLQGYPSLTLKSTVKGSRSESRTVSYRES